MKPNTCVGLETVTWKCNWSCVHCYFRRFPQLHSQVDTPLEQLKREIDAGKARGCKSVVLCGKGEPTLHKQIEDIISYIKSVDMYSLIITNGAVGIRLYEKLYALGLGHLQISVHGFGTTLDNISERKGASAKQRALLEWLHKKELPFRVNITMQQLNYHQIPDITRKVIELGAFHISLLNFLPHYHPGNNIKDVGVDPLKLVAPIEQAIEYGDDKVLFTLRYFPMCMLKPKYWKYVTNAQYVLFDPWEWEYGHLSTDLDKMWAVASASAARTGITGAPCNECLLKLHCGGWNRFYAEAYGMKGINAVKDVPKNIAATVGRRGGIFDLNPANKGLDAIK
jgi:MoaA/NifB/PqqE/SkfB family radical SAM enzyme